MREENLKKLRTEKKGLNVLIEKMPGFMIPSKEQRLDLYRLCNIDMKKYARSVDGIQLLVDSIGSVTSQDDFLFIEMKATASKSVQKLPFGFFFGFTQNEEELFENLSNYRLCLVHTTLKDYVLLKYDDYLSLIHSKRVQYQISLKKQF